MYKCMRIYLYNTINTDHSISLIPIKKIKKMIVV